MSLLADENVPTAVVRLLRRRGHAVASVRQAFSCGASDKQIAAYARRHNAIVVTWNKKHFEPLFPMGRAGGGALFFCCPVVAAVDRVESFLDTIELEYDIAQRMEMRLLVEIHPARIVVLR
jgi:hypothetical protein